ncbi:hypothetical protein LCGC14_1793210, partial [marine sediment metagenome]
NYSVIREFSGHGIGQSIHQEPSIPCFGKKGKGYILKEGMYICIEPMLFMGKSDIEREENGWNVKSKDKSLSAHFEHTIAVTEEGPEILSLFNEKNNKSSINIYSPLIWNDAIRSFGFALEIELSPDTYKRFSIFSPVATTPRLAISNNPIGILDHVFSEYTSVPFLQSQSSVSQADLTSYSFNCFFAERRPLAKIIDEFGRITAVNIWAADSGMIHYRTYAESGTAVVDKTLSPIDYNLNTFALKEQPLGSSVAEQDLAREVTAEFQYNFQRDKYEESVRAYPGNVPLCNSADAAGIKNSRIVRSQYIMETLTASLWLGNEVRKYCQGNEFVTFEGNIDLWDLELADVITVQHPSIVGSEAIYQIIEAEMDLIQGTARFQAAKLIA